MDSPGCKGASKSYPEKSQFVHNELYKCNDLFHNQKERRAEHLERLRNRRNEAINELRNIKELCYEEENLEMQTEPIPSAKKEKKQSPLKVMLSEWIIDVPEDLEYRWFFKVCPVGVRNLIIASKGSTKVYDRRNKLITTFYTSLPGGGKSNNRITVLDCIFRSQENTFYVIDCLAWNSLSLSNCSAEFRFYFTKSKFAENPDLSANDSNNKFKLKIMDHVLATKANLEEGFRDVFQMDDVQLPVDGILFYHMDGIYLGKQNPLVGWLKPYMLPEKFDVLVNEEYMKKKPRNYTTLENYLKEISIKYNKRIVCIGKNNGVLVDEDDMEY